MDTIMYFFQVFLLVLVMLGAGAVWLLAYMALTAFTAYVCRKVALLFEGSHHA